MGKLVTTSPDVMHGTACFAGTRVPVKTLFDHLGAGYNIDYFLTQFPTVMREQVIAVLDMSRERAEATAVATSRA